MGFTTLKMYRAEVTRPRYRDRIINDLWAQGAQGPVTVIANFLGYSI